MSRRTIGIVIFILVIIIIVFAFLNREIVKDGKTAHENAEIILINNGSETKLTFHMITEMGEKEFTAIFDSSDTDPEEHIYTGIPLDNIFENLGITLDDIKQVIVRGIDGYTVSLNPEEIKDKDNIYLAYKLNGKYLKSKTKGGSGPYQLVIKKDLFSQRWCKFVVEIEIK